MSAISGRHKRLDSVDNITWPDAAALYGSDVALISPTAISGPLASSTLQSRSSNSVRDKLSISRESSQCIGTVHVTNNSATPCEAKEVSSTSTAQGAGASRMENILRFKGVRVKLRSTPSDLSWRPIAMSTCCSCLCSGLGRTARQVSYGEILSASHGPKSSSRCDKNKDLKFVVHALYRKPGSPCSWLTREYEFAGPSVEQVRDWVNHINGVLQQMRHRPRNLLVIVNPYSGHKRARRVWDMVVAPIFMTARIKFHMVETTAMAFAHDLVGCMKAEELAQYHGIVAVGGDGLFQEVICGLLHQKTRGAQNAAVAARIRVGHVPAGSTDAVAYTLHGSRCAATAALHVALGDRLALDVARMDVEAANLLQEDAGDDHQQHSVPQSHHDASPCVSPTKAEAQRLALHLAPTHSTASISGPADIAATIFSGGLDGTTASSKATPLTGSGGSLSRSHSPPVPPGLVKDNTSTVVPPVYRDATHAVAANPGALSASVNATSSAAVECSSPSQTSMLPAWANSLRNVAAKTKNASAPVLGHAHGESPHHAAVAAAGAGHSTVPPITGFDSSNGSDCFGQYHPMPSVPHSLSSSADASANNGNTNADGDDAGGGVGGSACGGSKGPGLVGPVLGHKHFVCQAGYGFMGDVMVTSESLRWLGPARYDVTGALKLLGLRSYRVVISYLQASASLHNDVQQVCTRDCESCRQSSIHHANELAAGAVAEDAAYAAAGALATPRQGSQQSTGSNTAPATPLSGRHTPHFPPATNSMSRNGLIHPPRTHGASGASTSTGMLSVPAASKPQTPFAALADQHQRDSSPDMLSLDGPGTLPPTASACQGADYHGRSHTQHGDGADGEDVLAGEQTHGSQPAPGEDGWTTLEGEFTSVMCVVTPCRSDKSRKGIIPNGHLADGRMYLVLVSKCSRLGYLRFLLHLSTRGLADRCLPWVRVIPVTALRVRPADAALHAGGAGSGCMPLLRPGPAPAGAGTVSAWNVDGELVPGDCQVTMRIQRGLVDVFARGPEAQDTQ